MTPVVAAASTGRAAQRAFRFGVLSDVQHADIPDGASFRGVPRYYRAALESTRRSVAGWQAGGAMFAINFGDTVDGYAKENAGQALESVLSALAVFEQPLYHVIGNHDLYNLPRGHLNARLGIPSLDAAVGSSYYSVSPHPGWRIVLLDAYDVSELGWEAGHPHAQMAARLLEERNPNQEKNSPEGLEGTERRFVKFNGGVGPTQLQWLAAECQAAMSAGQRIILGSHVPIHPDSAPPSTLLWNYPEVLAVLDACPAVVATIAGHVHKDFHHCDANGVHHRVLKGIIETPPDQDCHAVVDVYEDRIELLGCGMESQVMPLRGAAAAPASKPAASFGEMAMEVMERFPAMQVGRPQERGGRQ
mmetsp:Transcript_38934/g.98585  ORF Transcript_38934/g.98585 Transcript_38934/m.98585 type:complete len:361 (+) Transcript_38934:202-1284(+)